MFKVIRTRTLTMLGNGLEFGTRNTIWLAEEMGIVKDKLEMRWSEPFWQAEGEGILSQNWKEFSRLELKKMRSSNNDIGRLQSLFKPVRSISLDQIGKQQALNYDPYAYSPVFGIHRLKLRYE